MKNSQNNESGQTGRKKEKRRGRRSGKEKILNLLIVLAVIFYAGDALLSNVLYSMDTGFNSLSANLSDLFSYYDRYGKMDSLYSRICRNSDQANLRMAVIASTGKEITSDTLNTWKTWCDSNETLYFLRNDGTLLSWDNAPVLRLSEEERNSLLQKKKYNPENSSLYYLAEPCENGTLILCVRSDNSSYFLETLGYYADCTVITFDAETGEPIPELTTGVLDGTAPRDRFQWFITDKPVTDKGQSPEFFWIPDSGYRLDGLYLGISGTWNYNGRNVFSCCCNPVMEIIGADMERAVIHILLLILFAVFLQRAARGFLKERREGSVCGNKRVFLKVFYTDSTLFSRTAFVSGVLCVVFLLTVGALETVTTYTDVSQRTEAVLDTIPEALSDRNKAISYVEDLFREQSLKTARNCLNLLEIGTKDSKQLTSVLNDIKDVLHADEISVFDKNGKITATTSGYEGYQLSKNEGDTENLLWSIINGADRELFLPVAGEPGKYYCAVRRTDDIGLICMKVSNQSVQTLINRLDLAGMFQNMSFDGSERLYVDRSEPAVLYRLMPDGKTTETLDSTPLPSLLSGERFCGTRVINGEKYYINGQGMEKAILYCAHSVSGLSERISRNFQSLIRIYVLIFLLVVLGNCVFLRKGFEQLEEQAQEAAAQSVPKEISVRVTQNQCVLSGVQALMIAISVVSILDYILTGTDSLLWYLFQGNWEKGIHIFSISMIIYSAILVTLGLRLINWFFNRLSREAGSRGLTVLQLSRNLTAAVAVIWMILFDLRQLGVDTATIIAGVGITGLALGIGAKDTITDLIAGFFLIISGNVLVGDRIEVDGFYGEVVGMGIRCTKLKCGTQIKTVHNSSLSKVISYSSDAEVKISFAVAPGTDLNRLGEAINASGERFHQAAPGLLKRDPVFGGVEQIGCNQLTCFMIVETEERFKSEVKTRCITELSGILTEFYHEEEENR